MNCESGVRMAFFEAMSAALGAVMVPLLLISGVYFAFRLRFFYILHPVGRCG